MSKPPKQPRRSRVITYRVSEAQFVRLAQRAAAGATTVNGLARDMALGNMQQVKVTAHKVCDPALLKQLYQIGHNLNQLVKNAHIFGRVSPQIEGLCLRIEALMDEALAAQDYRGRPPAGANRERRGGKAS